MKENRTQRAVIYCRVSSQKQKKEGHGLDSQATWCRQYAAFRGYEVIEIFNDDITGAITKRPGMQAMIALLRKHRKHDPLVVIVYDITRIARDIDAHRALRKAIDAAGGKLESPTHEFRDDADGEMQELFLATISHHFRRKNAETVRNRMMARTMNGYWCFPPPVGYRYKKVEGHGKLLVRDEPYATIVKDALEGYADGRFETKVEVHRFITSHLEWQHSSSSGLSWQGVDDLLNRTLYAGYIDLPDWGLHMLRGRHEPLISLETFQAVQRRLKGVAKAPARKDINHEFPLRGFVTCGGCGKPLQGCLSKGRTRYYPYYLCATKGCPDYGKSIQRDRVEEAFVDLLKQMRPAYALFAFARDVFQDAWHERSEGLEAQAVAIKGELATIEKGIAQLVDRIVASDSEAVIAAYERRIREFEERRALLQEKQARLHKPLGDFGSIFRTAMTFLANPYVLWVSGKIEWQRLVLRLAFAERLTYVRNVGFRTAATSTPFRLLEQFAEGAREMVDAAGIEPATPTMST